MDEELFSAIEAENYCLARDLCLKGAKADIKLKDGISALHLLSGHESQEASQVLEVCAREATNLNVKSIEGLTPVHVAALWGRLHNLKILISLGGDINQTDDEGNNALDFACLSGETYADKCIKFLLELESDADKEDTSVTEQVQHVGTGRQTAGGSHDHLAGLRTVHNNDDEEFSDTFYSAIANENALDRTVVTFPKLHPWHVDLSTYNCDETVVDHGFKHLSISSYSFADDQTLEELSSCHQHDSIDEDDDPASEFGDTTIFYDWKECSSILDQSIVNDSVIVPESLLKLSDSELKKELEKYGEIPGPIMPSTKNVYIKRLARLQSGSANSKDTQYGEYLPELRKHLEGRADTPDMFTVEESMCMHFDCKKDWREGTEKSSFNYLLIDSRVTQNLPVRAKKMSAEDVFRIFIMAIFYVGKGKRSRPYAHLIEALKSTKQNPKIQQIQDIWAAGHGVVSLHIFQSVIPVEAYTREACMIDALGLSRLTNKKRGDYYGRAQTWPQKKRREMGVFLLKRALKILLSEGERQLRPGDLRITHSS